MDQLDGSLPVLDFFKATYPNSGAFRRDEEEWRGYIGRFGITGARALPL